MQNFFSPLSYIAISFLSGIVLARALPQDTARWLQYGTVALGLAAIVMFIRRAREKTQTPAWFFRFSPINFLLPFFMFFGAAYFQYQQPAEDDPFDIIWYTDRDYETVLTAVVSDEPD